MRKQVLCHILNKCADQPVHLSSGRLDLRILNLVMKINSPSNPGVGM